VEFGFSFCTGDNMDVSRTVRRIAIFGELNETESSAITDRVVQLDLKRGQDLVREGDKSDAIFVVLFGRFSVYVKSRSEPVAEISAGELIGEIGFFSGQCRTATVVAARDSAVAKLDRAAFDEVVAANPKIYQAILNSLAGRLAQMTAYASAITQRKAVRTVAIVAGGHGGLLPSFVDRLRRVFGRRSRTLFLESAEMTSRFPDASPDHPTVSRWLNQCENDHDLVIYLGDETAAAWTQKAVRQADQVIICVHGVPTKELNAAEELAFLTHLQTHRRLVIVHERRNVTAAGTMAAGTKIWLSSRPVSVHHHVSVEDDTDFSRLHRFLTGRAIGFVAGGGGGFGPAHVGIFKALLERGVTFDIVGGTSIGASLMAGFAMMRTPERINDDVDTIFISSRALKRWTFPRYSFLDHVRLDDALREVTYGADIEDAWLPFFAMATDLSASAPYVFRSGPLWRALRASGSIPGALPPMFTADGRMLVDGGLVDNIPLKPMHSLKAGPNVVVHFGLPKFEAFPIDYDKIPGRWPLLARMLFSRRTLPAVPGPINVLRRSLFANATFDESLLGPHDLVLDPVPFPGSNFLDFDRHTDVFQASYRWAIDRVDTLIATADPVMTALIQASK
jgi:NTE family protein